MQERQVSGKLDGQVAIVTGAAQGLGAALAQRLAKEGCKVVVADMNLEKAQEVAAALPDAMAVHVDVSKEEMVNRLVDQTVENTAGWIFLWPMQALCVPARLRL